MIKSYIGYHGTSQRSADSIMRDPANPVFRISTGDDQWLGDGVYFFEDDPAAGKWWVTQVKNYRKWAIIKAQIDVPEDDLFNLVLEEHRKVLDQALMFVTRRLDRMSREAVRPRDAEAINHLCTKIAPNITVVRAAFACWKTRFSRRHLSRIEQSQIQIAVRESGLPCLSNVYIVGTSEEESA